MSFYMIASIAICLVSSFEAPLLRAAWAQIVAASLK